MSWFVIVLGLSTGLLLGSAGMVVVSRFRDVPGLASAVRIVNGLATAALLVGVLLGWMRDGVPSPAWTLALAAAVAAPLLRRRDTRLSWDLGLLLLPALLLAGGALLWAVIAVPAPSRALLGVLTAFCGGLGARALGEALRVVTLGKAPSRWPATATCIALTTLVSGLGLLNLWQRGIVWRVAPLQSGLVGAWLAWIGARLWPRRHPRVRAGLVVVATLLLVALVVQ